MPLPAGFWSRPEIWDLFETAVRASSKAKPSETLRDTFDAVCEALGGGQVDDRRLLFRSGGGGGGGGGSAPGDFLRRLASAPSRDGWVWSDHTEAVVLKGTVTVGGTERSDVEWVVPCDSDGTYRIAQKKKVSGSSSSPLPAGTVVQLEGGGGAFRNPTAAVPASATFRALEGCLRGLLRYGTESAELDLALTHMAGPQAAAALAVAKAAAAQAQRGGGGAPDARGLFEGVRGLMREVDPQEATTAALVAHVLFAAIAAQGVRRWRTFRMWAGDAEGPLAEGDVVEVAAARDGAAAEVRKASSSSSSELEVHSGSLPETAGTYRVWRVFPVDGRVAYPRAELRAEESGAVLVLRNEGGGSELALRFCGHVLLGGCVVFWTVCAAMLAEAEIRLAQAGTDAAEVRRWNEARRELHATLSGTLPLVLFAAETELGLVSRIVGAFGGGDDDEDSRFIKQLAQEDAPAAANAASLLYFLSQADGIAQAWGALPGLASATAAAAALAMRGGDSAGDSSKASSVVERLVDEQFGGDDEEDEDEDDDEDEEDDDYDEDDEEDDDEDVNDDVIYGGGGYASSGSEVSLAH